MNEAVKLAPTLVREQIEGWLEKGQLYALVDPFFEIGVAVERARLETRDTDPLIYDVIAWDQVTYQPPYLVKVTREVLDWIQLSLATERWGVFVASTLSMEALAAHYQKFIIARGPDSNPYFLRFHDASVLDVLLQTWTAKEKSVFFSPAMALGLPDLDTLDVKIEVNPFRGFKESPAGAPAPEDCLLQLRDGQLKQCGEAIDRDLVKVIYWHLRNHHAKAVQFVDKARLHERIQFAINKGRRYGLATVADLAGFSALMFELAPNFDEHPSFRKVLVDGSVPAEGKMKRLSQVISDREWQEAAELYDREFWASSLNKKR
jgi:hypothetical protein